MVTERKRQTNRDRYERALLAGASRVVSGPRLTGDVTKASKVRDPDTGKVFRRDSPAFKKMEKRVAT